MAQRPTFLTIICILIAIYGILMLIAGIAIFGLDSFFADWGVDTGGFFKAAGVVAIITGIVALVVFFLLKNGNKLGWYLVMIFLILNAVFGLVFGGFGLLALIITIFLVWYFLRPNVRAFFGI